MKAKKIQIALTFIFICLIFIPRMPSKAEAYDINWSPAKIQEVVQVGETQNLNISFISSKRLENVNLVVDDNLQTFVTIQQNYFSTIEPDISYNIDLNISVPDGAELGLYNGNISVKSGKKTYPQPFKIELRIGFNEMSLDFSESRSLPFLTNGKVLFENVKYENDRYIAVMEWDNVVFRPIAMRKLDTVEISTRTITIDGSDDDWTDILPVVVDPEGDKDIAYNSSPGTDLANLYIARDQEYFYFLMTLHDGDPQEGVLYEVEFQQYLTQLHTPGDRFVIVANHGNGWYSSIIDRTELGDCRLNFTDYIGIGIGMLEWKIPIAAFEWRSTIQIPQPYFPPSPQGIQGVENRFVRTYIHPMGGNVSDDNDALTRPMIINFYK